MPKLTSRWAIAPLLLAVASVALPGSAQTLTSIRLPNALANSVEVYSSTTARLSIAPGAIASNPTCPGMNTGDRRVASGSVSTRYIYWVLRAPSGGFYLTYWAQHDCTQWQRTQTYSTQREAYEAFMCQYIEERCNP